MTHVSSSDIAEFRDARLKTISASSVNRELSIISDTINTAITEWNCYIAESPVKAGLRKENPKRIRRLKDNEYQLLMNSCKRIEHSGALS